MKAFAFAFFVATFLCFAPETTVAQNRPTEPFVASPAKALGLSLVLPGLGHRHAEEGNWTRSAITYAVADASLWLSFLGSTWHRSHLIQSYETLAIRSAGANLDGKDRTFYLNLASFESSDIYLETMLRNRAWDRIDYVSDPNFQWEWTSDDTYNEFRDLRNRSESLKRRKSILIASLVANRLLSGAISARKAGKSRNRSFSAVILPPADRIPTVALRMGF